MATYPDRVIDLHKRLNRAASRVEAGELTGELFIRRVRIFQVAVRLAVAGIREKDWPRADHHIRIASRTLDGLLAVRAPLPAVA